MAQLPRLGLSSKITLVGIAITIVSILVSVIFPAIKMMLHVDNVNLFVSVYER